MPSAASSWRLPIVGAFVGIVLIGRLHVQLQNRLIVPLALAMPVPLLAVALHPPIGVVVALFVASGMLQAFMVPLQATFTLVTQPELRGRIFSLAGSVSVAAAGASFLVAGWFGQHLTPYLGVAVCAAITHRARRSPRALVAAQTRQHGGGPGLRPRAGSSASSSRVA